MAIPVGIAGIGHHIPEWVVDNHYFTQFVETSDEWIQQRTGIKERRWLAEGEAPSDLSVEAGRMALEQAGIAPGEVDLIVLGTISGDYLFPSCAGVVQDKLGCVNAAAFDLSAACSGFIYALNTGQQFIATGTYRTVLCIGGDALSRVVDIRDRNSCVLFGDGAGAVVLRPFDEVGQGRIDKMMMGADGSGWDFICRPDGGALNPVTPEILEEGTHLIRLRGRAVYRFAVDKMTEIMSWAGEGIDPEEVGLVIPHQVNQRILETAISKIGLTPEKLLINIDRVGNTSSGSVPILMSEAFQAGRFEKDKYLLLAAFGAGLTWAGARIQW